jgi:demethylmenaquinone methyltransferase/2-methoxy-6-polyprenyl-1,4-benzoquinol methylase
MTARPPERSTYDRLAPIYDLVSGPFEWPWVRAGLARLDARPGERVLELGHGTGRALVALAAAVGPTGRVICVDLSEGMHRQARARLDAAGLSVRVALERTDALALPLAPASLDAAFAAFTVETFPAAQALELLGRLREALWPGGRVVLVFMARGGAGVMARLYAWSHRAFPSLVDCAPVDGAGLLRAAGFTVDEGPSGHLAGIPVAVARGVRG